jgi:signal peptidase II
LDRSRYWPFGIPALIVLLDRCTKHYIETQLAPWDTVSVIPGLFQIVYARNTGMAFSLFDNSGAGRTSPLLIVFTTAVIGIVVWLLWQAAKPESKEPGHWSYRLALGLILGGALGNLYDRIAVGSVTDFLDFFWNGAHFPAFNAADSSITCGAILVVLNLWIGRHPKDSRPVEVADPK